MRKFWWLKEQKINILITGATGCGKSSTINALFNTEKAKIGVGADPETMDIEKYELDNLVLWDSPGLGDGVEADNRHSKNIIKKLNEKDKDGNLLIDLVLVILDGYTRDYGTTFNLINKVIIPNLGVDKNKRILIAINKADMVKNRKYWNENESRPEPKLIEFLEEKVSSVQKRIRESTGVNVEPIYYSAGEKEEGEVQEKPYNLSKLMYYIVKSVSKKKRLSFIENINHNDIMWESNDKLKNYNENIRETFAETFFDCISDGAEIGAEIGSIFGKTGEFIGRICGGGGGAVWGFLKGIANKFFS